MSITDFFRLLGAPLANQRWSWGAIRDADQAVFLRVWQDQVQNIDGIRSVLVVDDDWCANNPQNPGYQERLAHLAAIRNGAASYLIMCVAKDATAESRDIHKYNRDHLFVGGKLRTHGSEERLEIVGKVDSRSVRSS